VDAAKTVLKFIFDLLVNSLRKEQRGDAGRRVKIVDRRFALLARAGSGAAKARWTLGLLALAAAGCGPEPPPCRIEASAVDDLRVNGQCLIVERSRVLAIRHRASGKYDLPGGTRRRDETAQCTAHRETFEETGLVVVVGRRLSTFPGAAVYQCAAQGPVPERIAVPRSGVLEVEGVEWVEPDDIDPDGWRFESTPQTIESVLGPRSEDSTTPRRVASPGGFEPPLPP
jgi:8-oxo-dGTP pyrophosphatase MutT (NUDIX family)